MNQPLTNSLPLLDDPCIEHLLVEITALAQRFAAEVVWRRPDVVDDIAQEVVLDCLLEIREGRWCVSDEGLPGFVCTMVKRRAIDWLRAKRRRQAREQEHERELSEGTHAWMSPELAYDVEELRAIRDRALAVIPLACRRAYLMVREDHLTYDDAAALLGVSRRSVTSYVVRAQRRFRQELERQGIGSRYRNGRPAPRDRDSVGWRP